MAVHVLKNVGGWKAGCRGSGSFLGVPWGFYDSKDWHSCQSFGQPSECRNALDRRYRSPIFKECRSPRYRLLCNECQHQVPPLLLQGSSKTNHWGMHSSYIGMDNFLWIPFSWNATQNGGQAEDRWSQLHISTSILAQKAVVFQC